MSGNTNYIIENIKLHEAIKKKTPSGNTSQFANNCIHKTTKKGMTFHIFHDISS